MQTIARANRVAEGKENGLVIDYVGIVKACARLFADYTTEGRGTGGTDPTVDKQELIKIHSKIMGTACAFPQGTRL